MKLEDINKQNIYKVPDNYFDQLPMRIQSRVDEKKPVLGLSHSWNLALKIAFPALAVVLIIFYIAIPNTKTTLSADEILAQVSTEDLIAYIEITDITVDDIIEEIDFSEIELNFDDYVQSPEMQEMEMNQENINALMDEYGIDNDML